MDLIFVNLHLNTVSTHTTLTILPYYTITKSSSDNIYRYSFRRIRKVYGVDDVFTSDVSNTATIYVPQVQHTQLVIWLVFFR